MNDLSATPHLRLTDHAGQRWDKRWAEQTGLELDDDALAALVSRICCARQITGPPLRVLSESIRTGAVRVRIGSHERETWAIRIGEKWIYFVLRSLVIITVLPLPSYQAGRGMVSEKPIARRSKNIRVRASHDDEN